MIDSFAPRTTVEPPARPKRLRLGYRMPRVSATWGRTTWLNTLAALATIGGNLLTMLLAAWAGLVMPEYLPFPLIPPFTVILWILVARAQRGLEAMTHEGSHFHFAPRRAVNDFIANLAALPMAMNLLKYRFEHSRDHHAGFGGPADPDRIRYEEYDAESIDRTSARRFAATLAARFIRYAKGWLVSAGTKPVELLLALVVHAALFAPLAVAYGAGRVIVVWLIFWLFPYLTVLQVIRMIGESAEHIYRGGSTVFDSTISNTGWLHRLLIHPHGDGYHVLHHLAPAIPHFRLRKCDERLRELDANGFGRSMTRTRLLETPARPVMAIE